MCRLAKPGDTYAFLRVPATLEDLETFSLSLSRSMKNCLSQGHPFAKPMKTCGCFPRVPPSKTYGNRCLSSGIPSQNIMLFPRALPCKTYRNLYFFFKGAPPCKPHQNLCFPGVPHCKAWKSYVEFQRTAPCRTYGNLNASKGTPL